MLPEAAVSSDFIVGFSGETDARFPTNDQACRTLSIQEQLHFSVQRAAGHQGGENLPDDIPREVKIQRNNDLLAVQDAIAKGGQFKTDRPERRSSGRRPE